MYSRKRRRAPRFGWQLAPDQSAPLSPIDQCRRQSPSTLPACSPGNTRCERGRNNDDNACHRRTSRRPGAHGEDLDCAESTAFRDVTRAPDSPTAKAAARIRKPAFGKPRRQARERSAIPRAGRTRGSPIHSPPADRSGSSSDSDCSERQHGVGYSQSTAPRRCPGTTVAPSTGNRPGDGKHHKRYGGELALAEMHVTQVGEHRSRRRGPTRMAIDAA